jgi:Zn-finger nucleic acid-binding protein
MIPNQPCTLTPMNACPSCKSARLAQDDLEPGLKARHCPHCRGHWIPFAEYLPWIEGGARTGEATLIDKPSELFDSGGQSVAEPIVTSSARSATAAPGPAPARVKLCPECGRFLRRYQLDLNLEIEVERCGGCAGVWCDRGKWARLRQTGAHSRLHFLFSDSWQSKLKEEQARKRQEDRVRSILGDADFERVRLFKAWVDSHPQRATLRAFLAEDFESKPRPSTR